MDYPNKSSSQHPRLMRDYRARWRISGEWDQKQALKNKRGQECTISSTKESMKVRSKKLMPSLQGKRENWCRNLSNELKSEKGRPSILRVEFKTLRVKVEEMVADFKKV